MNELLLVLVVILIVAVMAIAVLTMRRLNRQQRALRRIEADLVERLVRLESRPPAKIDETHQNGVRDLATMVDGIASVGMRLERRISALEISDRQLPTSAKNSESR